MSQRFTANGWQVASIYRPDTGDVVQLNELVPEYCGLEHGIVTTEGTAYKLQSAKNKVLKLGSTDYDAFETLRQWSEEKRLVRAVVAGSDRNVQWYESVEIGEFINEPKANRRDGDTKWGVVLEKIGRNPAIYNNQNLLAYLGWADVNPVNNIPDNWDSSFATNTFASNVLTISTTSNLFCRVRQTDQNRLVFPISGIRLWISAFLNTNRAAIGFTELNFSFTNISDASINEGAYNGVQVYNAITNSNVFWINANILRKNAEVTTYVNSVSFPALTTNGRLTPGNKFMSW